MAIDNPQRERILARLRAATAGEVIGSQPKDEQTIFPAIPDVLQRFLSECAANLTEVALCRDATESAAAFERLLPSIPDGELFFQDSEVFRSWVDLVDSSRAIRWSSQGPPPESTQATFTLAHAFVAQAGSMLVSTRCGGRGATIVSACHVVFGKVSQIVPDIEAAMQQANRDLLGASFVGLISGSSRTADIEKILVQGAHGPRRVVIIMQEQD